jgi:hypothetical protein
MTFILPTITNSRSGPKASCPSCARSLVFAQCPPAPGDMSVCFHCACVAIFTEELKLRAMDESEHGRYSQNTILQKCVSGYVSWARGRHRARTAEFN